MRRSPGSRFATLHDADVRKIVQCYRRRESVDKYAVLATYDQIAAKDYNLNIERYVDTFEAKAEIDVAAVQVRSDALEVELDSVQRQLGRFLRGLGLCE